MSRAGRNAGPPRPARRQPPVPQESVELTVDGIGARGDGIARGPGGVYYLPLTVPGDRVRARPVERRGDGLAAEVVELLAPGPARVPPPCAHVGACGGCALQQMEDGAYAGWKLEQLRALLDRAGFADVPLGPLARTPPGGRRRVVLSALGSGGGRVRLGFMGRRSHSLADIAACPVAAPAIQGLLAPLRALLGRLLRPNQGLDVAVTLLDDGLDLVLVGELPAGLETLEALAAFAEAADLARLAHRPNPGAPLQPVAMRRTGLVELGGVTVSPPPGGFLQASRDGERALQAAVFQGLAGARRIADLFAGCGTFTLGLARGAPVHAADSDAAAIAALKAAADRAGLAVTTEVRNLMERPLIAAELDAYDAVLFDPPRAGAARQAAELARSRVARIAAVSCNPTSFVRDARTLVDGGYRLLSIAPVDQFLWSPHLELTALLER